MATLNDSITAWLSHFLACIGGCFGCGARATTPGNEPSKGMGIQARSEPKKSTLSDDFWSSSAGDLDMPHRTVTQTLLAHPATRPEFLNPGLRLWNQTRLQWTGGNSKTRNQPKQSRELHLSWNATYESLLTTKRPFRNPIPLSDMVELLVDVWEHEGLYD